MSDEKIHDLFFWERVALLLLAAADTIKRQESSLILKWDGERENGKIYTLIWETAADIGSSFRLDTDDLESALASAFSTYKCYASELVPQVAPFISTLDNAARASLVISLHLAQSAGRVHSHIMILDPKNKNILFDQKSKDLLVLLRDSTIFLEPKRGK